MSRPSTNSVLFNVSGVAILATVAFYMGYSYFHSETVERCSSRYPAGKQFALESGIGDFLTPIELQGRASGREWGILKNTRVVASPDAPGKASLQVDLATSDEEDESHRSGVGFVWPSTELAKAKSACLSYSVLLPPSFQFSAPGYLPGLYATPDTAEIDEQTPADGFVARVGWSQGGEVGVDVHSTGQDNFWLGSQTPGTWPRGRWVPVDQEVTLGPTGSGTVRLWIDGKLQLENRSAHLKSESAPGLSGVVADIGYSHGASDPASVEVSPFVVQWQ